METKQGYGHSDKSNSNAVVTSANSGQHELPGYSLHHAGFLKDVFTSKAKIL